MFETLMREATMMIARIHDALLRLNDDFALPFGDKELHFLVMLLLSMVLFFAVNFVFKRLAKYSVTAISFIYVFTVMAVLGFAIEVGQRVTGTGSMDFGDIVAGLQGVLLFFGVYALYRLLLTLLRLVVRALTGSGKGRRN